MPVFRRGEVPRPPHGIDEHADEIYTQGGFFGDWVHIFRRHNPGVPKSWSSDEVMYAGADAGAMVPSDLDDPRGEPMPVLEGDGIRVLVSRRSQTMPFAERNADFNQIRFYHSGDFVLDTELGPLTAAAGDLVVVGRGIAYREKPSTTDNLVLVFEVEDPVVGAETLWDAAGFASMFVDYAAMTLPEPAPAAADEDTEVRVWSEGSWHTITYDFDPCGDAVGWVGDPVVYRFNVEDVPGIGTSRGFLPPPAHAILMSQSKSFFFNVLGVPPSPTVPAPEGSFGAPVHLNDYDEVWFNHASEFLPQNVGHLWLFPRTVPHPGFKREPSHPPNPVRKYGEVKINFDTKARLRWTPQAREALLEGDVRRSVFLSLYGMPPEAFDERGGQT